MRGVVVLIAAGFVSAIGCAFAQPNPLNIAPDFLRPQLSMSGDALQFCIAEDSYLRDLETVLAEEIGAALLVSVDITYFALPWGSRPYDYALSTDNEDIYVLLVNECDAFLSMPIPRTQIDDWLSLSRALFRTEYVLATTRHEYERLADVPREERVGARISSSADLALAVHNSRLSPAQRWRRLQYQDNLGLAERILDGTLVAGFIWGPALPAIQHEIGTKFHIIDPHPMPTPSVDFSAAVLAQNSYLLSALDEAIEFLYVSGRLGEIVSNHGVLPPVQ